MSVGYVVNSRQIAFGKDWTYIWRHVIQYSKDTNALFLIIYQDIMIPRFGVFNSQTATK
jgi:hypothetical protein